VIGNEEVFNILKLQILWPLMNFEFKRMLGNFWSV
jgi:hypothetical protein